MTNVETTKYVDLSQIIDSSTFTFIGCFPGSRYSNEAKFNQDIIIDTREQSLSGFKKSLFGIACDIGTHIDSPSHWFCDKRSISDLTLSELTSPGIVIDVTFKIENNIDYELTVEDLLLWEKKYGIIPDKCIVLMKTGWSSNFKNHKKYMGLDSENNTHFPGFSKELALFLIKERNIVGIGIDTGSLDCGNAIDYPVHNIILGADKYQIENLVLDKLNENDKFTIIAMPLNIKDAPEAPARVMAIVSQ